MIKIGPKTLTRTKTLFVLAVAVLLGHCSWAFAGNILIDPGHSQKFPGAISCSGIAEYRYNNLLATEIVDYLSLLGHNVSLTRSENSLTQVHDFFLK